ncbi:uncharacterized protein EAE98_001929 [Botrytis deweyae]|uniref:Uncharacterized protein n=1 Tax=Botrytis deweyae TaxID=2478750 RepID=A0ABQ7IZ89_9HELO|nr:uncharacterized protein EAE98_001929 [Botrytis deweyae]KAF7937615.1 hypothetical protein EAE98_001929 [Botrytis deweyae]
MFQRKDEDRTAVEHKKSIENIISLDASLRQAKAFDRSGLRRVEDSKGKTVKAKKRNEIKKREKNLLRMKAIRTGLDQMAFENILKAVKEPIMSWFFQYKGSLPK